MKNLVKTALVCAIAALSLTSSAQNAPQREHRAIWMTPFLSNNWPSAAITDRNATSLKNILDSRLKKFRDQNFNVLYYHCRSMCDATYESSYEPWSSSVSGTRGTAPAFDPFGYLVEKAHENGIEVYAWINPYRYCSRTSYGDDGGDLNYENSHPDWLIKQTNETILNPGLEEVKQRIVDVISEIVTKYDVDGVIFDDYFYTSSTPMSLDADLYNKYKNNGGKLSQADWRRANVNEMVERVNKAIKAIKPYVAFGISPAGVASPPTVTSEYGLPAAPGGGDWQYNGIYSDPLAWYKAGSIDFMSPQIYWPGRYVALGEWWATAAAKFNRHCYPSVTLSSVSTYKYDEFANEILETRRFSPAGASGYVFFDYGQLVNYYEKWNGKTQDMPTILGQDVYNTKVLTPLRPWTPSPEPEMVTNVRIENGVLTWDGNDAGRYAIYKVPETQTSRQLTLDCIRYSDSYTLPDDAADYSWYVAAYDRYGKVTPALGVGATKQTGTAPVLVYPAEGDNPVDLFEFKWNHESNLHLYTLELARDAAFTDMIGTVEAEGNSVSVTKLPSLTAGQKYFWRIKATDVNCEHPVSETRSFIAPRIAMTNPTNASSGFSITGKLSWTAAVEGAQYTVEISRSADVSKPVFTQTVNTTEVEVPAYTLMTGARYYARVTATLDEASSSSEIVSFTTVDRDDYAAPVFVNPAQDGMTLHSDQPISVEPWEGMSTITVQISTSDTFPSRTGTLSCSLDNFSTETQPLGSLKLSSKNLVDGTTYYLRARGSYSLSTSTALQYTDYTPVVTFVYSSQAGVDDMTADGCGMWLENGTMLHVGDGISDVNVYSVAGVLVATYSTKSGATVDLSALPGGVYIVKGGATTLKVIL